jgi:DNA-binding transcriptional MocR family regulator
MAMISGVQLARLLVDWRLAAARGPAYVRLAAALRALVVDGRLPQDGRLPAERELAARLAVSRTTVTAAYDALRREGFLRARRGSGTFTSLPDGHVHQASGWTAVGGSAALDLAVASPDAVPDAVEAAVARATARLGPHLRGHGYDVLGLPALREAVAGRYEARGLPTSPDQVVVVAGALAGIGLVTRAVLAPGDRVVVDTPTYPNALEVVRRSGGRPTAVGLGDDGWDLDLLDAAYRQVLPRMGYVVADFANPTGHLLDGDGRAALVRSAARAGSTLVVDETLVDVVLDDVAMPPPVAAFDEDDAVVSVGSMSKSHWGGLRTGWVRAPRSLVVRFAETRGALDLAPPVLEQLVAAELLADDDALARRREQVRQRRDALVEALREHCPTWTWRPPSGGLALWVRLDEPIATALASAAARHGVRLVPGARFTVDGTGERHVRLPYALPEQHLHEAVRRLAAACADLGSVTPPLAAVT